MQHLLEPNVDNVERMTDAELGYALGVCYVLLRQPNTTATHARIYDKMRIVSNETKRRFGAQITVQFASDMAWG